MDANTLSRLIANEGKERSKVYEEELRKLEDQPFARFEWAKHAAILGVADAVEEVVAAYKVGIGTEPDQVQAFEWMKKGAEVLQITSLYFELAQAYRDGLGTPRNVEKFWEFMGKAAKLKDTEAMFELAEAHTNADLGQQSPERAADWTIKGAAAGDPVASIKVARRYQFGNGVKANPDKFFEWADKAVNAARSRLTEAETAQNVGWGAYEDYPDALMALADAYRQRGALAKAEKTALLAADAARDAIEFAKREGDTVNVGKSKSLPEIMLARLREFRTRNGDIDKRRSAAYLQWLQAINEGIRRVYFSEDGHNAIPQGLVQAIFELAVAYEKGIGTPVNKAKTAEYMAQAAKAGHGEAAYRCAMKYYKAGKMLEFEEYLAMGASDFRVRHALALKDCELPRSEFLTALDVLSALRNTVHEIRSSRHTITPQEAPNGVAHYTGDEGLASMLGDDSTQARNVVRLYNTAYVNDPREGKRLKTFEKKRFVNPLRDFFATNETSHEAISWQGQEYVVFVACFSLSWDNLDLWRFYGRDGAGYSVVSPVTAFDTDSTQDMLHGGTRADKTSVMPPITLYKVLYEDDDAELALRELAQPLAKVRSLMNRVSSEAREHLRSIAAAIVSELLYLYKNKDYKQEEEVRAVAARTLRDPELRQHAKAFGPFAKLFIETGPILFQQPGSSIIIGPKVEKSKAIMLDIKHRLEKGGFASCVVERSKVSYG